MTPDKWKWFGHPAHFILGQRCRFHMATKAGKYLISTVGELPKTGTTVELMQWDTLGASECFYETFVFLAGRKCSSKNCGCGLPDISGMEVDSLRSITAGEATKTHYRMCKKWSTR